jgi:hypothetical protein
VLAFENLVLDRASLGRSPVSFSRAIVVTATWPSLPRRGQPGGRGVPPPLRGLGAGQPW